MKTRILLVLFVSLGSTLAKPTTLLGVPTLIYATLRSDASGAPLGADGRVVDTPEVTIAKVQHAAAQFNERSNLANEAAKSEEIEISHVLVPQAGVPILKAVVSEDLAEAGLTFAGTPLTLASIGTDSPAAAPVGVDGRVVDTPAVAQAKAQHAAAYLNEKLNLSNEAVRNTGFITITAPSALALRL